jgi:hypothetical protein
MQALSMIKVVDVVGATAAMLQMLLVPTAAMVREL